MDRHGGIELQVGPIDAPLLHTPGAVSMGNPHVVFFVDDIDTAPVTEVGPTSGPAAGGTSVTISGSGMDWHDMESYFRPNGIGRYSFVGDNEIVFNKPGRQFDGVIMMDCSQCPIHP